MPRNREWVVRLEGRFCPMIKDHEAILRSLTTGGRHG